MLTSLRWTVALQEAHLKEAAAALQQEIANLTRLVEVGAGLSSLDDNIHEDLQRRNEDLAKERDEEVLPFTLTATCFLVTS